MYESSTDSDDGGPTKKRQRTDVDIGRFKAMLHKGKLVAIIQDTL